MENLTSKVSCFARAYHALTGTVHVFNDTAAARLLGEEYGRIAGSMRAGRSFFLPGFEGTDEEALALIVTRVLAPSVLGRSALCEAALREAAEAGIRQTVIFAAGMDSTGIRHAHSGLRVFELDLPEASDEKQRAAAEAGLESCSVYVPCDLAEPGWNALLAEKGFRADEPCFASLLGISYYLDRVAMTALIKAIGGIMTEGSVLCMDYPEAAVDSASGMNRSLAAAAGEAMKAKYGFDEMRSLLEAGGLRVREHLNAHEMTKRFFAAYNAASPALPMTAPEGVGYIVAEKL